MFWQTQTTYEFGQFRVDARERRLLRDGEVVPLTPKVFDILLVLVQNKGHILSKDEVIRLVWPDTAVEEGNIARNISTLRNALGERPRDSKYIQTVPWRGYRFVANVKEVTEEPARPSINSIAVLPFADVANDPGLEYLGEGIAENLIHNLSQLSQLKVMSRNSTFRYKGCETDASVVGKELKVQAVLTGRLARHDDLISISVELADARAQEQQLARRHTENAEAYQLYLKGRYYFNKLTVDGVQKGIEHHQQAIGKDPQYALAYAALGDCYNYFARPVDAKQAVRKALELDETLGEAHASLGFFKFIYDWDFAGAETEFRQALMLSPNYAEAHHWSAIYFANIGRHEEAGIEARLAVELDPLSLLMNMTPALASYLARNYDVAVEQLQKVIEMEPNFAAAHSVLGNVYLQQGSYAQTMSEYQKVLDLSKGVTPVEMSMKAVIAHACAKSGQRSEAIKLLDELTAASGESGQLPGVLNVSPHSIAEINAALGRIDEAFRWLNKAFEQHDMQMVSLKTNPTLDGLRSQPRFADLVRRVGLPM